MVVKDIVFLFHSNKYKNTTNPHCILQDTKGADSLHVFAGTRKIDVTKIITVLPKI